MELKTYQRQVIADLNRYLELLGETKDYIASFCLFCRSAAPLSRKNSGLPEKPPRSSATR